MNNGMLVFDIQWLLTAIAVFSACMQQYDITIVCILIQILVGVSYHYKITNNKGSINDKTN